MATNNFKSATLPGNISNPIDLDGLMRWIEAARATLKGGAA